MVLSLHTTLDATAFRFLTPSDAFVLEDWDYS